LGNFLELHTEADALITSGAAGSTGPRLVGSFKSKWRKEFTLNKRIAQSIYLYQKSLKTFSWKRWNHLSWDFFCL